MGQKEVGVKDKSKGTAMKSITLKFEAKVLNKQLNLLKERANAQKIKSWIKILPVERSKNK